MNDIDELLAWVEKVASASKDDALAMIRAANDEERKNFQRMKADWHKKLAERKV